MIRATPRLWAIWKVVRRYQLSEFWNGTPSDDPRPRGERLRLALQELGPVFIKFGQALSTRPDILPHDVASELAQLQDKVEPFSGAEARALIERSLGKPVAELFQEFDETPLAAASVAQVHTARLKPSDAGDPGFEVVVKVLRPGVHERVRKDVELLRALADFAERWHPLGKRLRPREVVAEYERVIFDELDLMREGANCSLLRRNWLGSELIYHPIVFWDFTRADVLVMERIHGVSLRELDRLRELGVNFQVLAERGVEIFFKQVFRDNFFHADMHPGNIFVDVTDVKRPSYLAVDFGIVGQLGPADLRYLAENFLAFFNRDYRRIAELHVQAGWMPAHIRIDELEAAARAVCEPYFTRPLSEISLAEVLAKLFRTAQRYELTLQPQLILLQKTLLNIEGVGRQLDPKIDIWAVARPVLEKILVERYSPQRLASELRKRLPEMVTRAPEVPRLLHAWLQQQVEGRHTLAMRSQDLREVAHTLQALQKRMVAAILGVGLLIAAALLYALEAGGPQLLGAPVSTWIAGLGGAWALLAAWPRR